MEETFGFAIAVKKNFFQGNLMGYKRDYLNYGHTFGHALEKITGKSHGECVSVGMVYASILSHTLHLLKDNELLLIVDSIRQFGLTATLKELTKKEIIYTNILNLMRLDKKNSQFIHFKWVT